MGEDVWNTVAGKLTDRWASAVAPAVLFWAGGVLAWVYAGTDWSRLSKITATLGSQNVAAKAAALFGAIIVLMISAVVVQRLTTPVLRLLEGYWPAWLVRITARRRRHVLTRKANDDSAFQDMQHSIDTTAVEPNSPRDRSTPSHRRIRPVAGQRGRLQHRVLHRPRLDAEVLPIRNGNILRAAETHPYHHYGLDAVVTWPHPWLMLPKTAVMKSLPPVGRSTLRSPR